MREVRSFVTRKGRVNKNLEKTFLKLKEKYFLDFETEGEIDLKSYFDNSKELVLEIGFGSGENALNFAKSNSQKSILGIDVYYVGMLKLVSFVASNQVDNLKISNCDAEKLVYRIKNASLSGVHMFFPDPWPKKKHHKRRLLQVPFLHEICRILKADGYFYIITDCADYANWIENSIVTENSFYIEKEDKEKRKIDLEKGESTFYKKALEKGHSIFDFFLKKRKINQRYQ